MTNMGAKHKELQEKLEEYLGVEQIDLFTNGHMALEMSLQEMVFPKGGEVITTPFIFASTTHAIVRNGLEQVFCDINPVDSTMDVTKIEALITDRTVDTSGASYQQESSDTSAVCRPCIGRCGPDL